MSAPRTRPGPLVDRDGSRPEVVATPQGFADSLAAFRAARGEGGQAGAEDLLRERALADAAAAREATRR